MPCRRMKRESRREVFKKQINRTMNDLRKTIKIVKKGEDDENLKYFLGLSHKERLEHLELLRTEYIKWQKTDDSKQGFQRVYKIIRRA